MTSKIFRATVLVAIVVLLCAVSIIMGVLLAQAFNLNIIQGFYMYHSLEVFTWITGVILLRRKTKEYVVVMGLSIMIAFVYQLITPHWG